MYLVMSNAGTFVSDRIAGAGGRAALASFVSYKISGRASCLAGVRVSSFASDMIEDVSTFVSDRIAACSSCLSDTFAGLAGDGVPAWLPGTAVLLSDAI